MYFNFEKGVSHLDCNIAVRHLYTTYKLG